MPACLSWPHFDLEDHAIVVVQSRVHAFTQGTAVRDRLPVPRCQQEVVDLERPVAHDDLVAGGVPVQRLHQSEIGAPELVPIKVQTKEPVRSEEGIQVPAVGDRRGRRQAGRLVMPFLGLYCASKFALEAFAEALRYELSALGIDSVIVEPGPFRTGIHSRPARAEEQACLQDYGQIAQAESHVLGDLQQAVAAPNVPTDPQLVVDAVLRLIATPAGERPLRTVVGMDFGVTQLNDATAHLTDVALTGMGLSQLQSIKTANAQP